jgi:ornithine lipid hydroxylase
MPARFRVAARTRRGHSGPVLRRLTAYAAYPVMTAGGVCFALWAIGHGWPAWRVGVVAFAVGMVLVTLLERFIPFSKAWSSPRGDRLTDLWHMVVSNRAFDVGTLIAIAIGVPLGGWISARVGVALWPHGWPVLLQALVAVLVYELPWYWFHRLEHEVPLLWRMHAVHHSSRRIYWWNFSRNHPFDNLVSAILAIVPLSVLGVGEAPLAVMAGFSAAHGLLQHSNVDLRTGWLDWFFSTARVHRWHHSPIRSEADSNYSPRLTLWDHVFGTYNRKNAHALPSEDVGLGAAQEGFPETFVAQLLVPFDGRYWSAQPKTRRAEAERYDSHGD